MKTMTKRHRQTILRKKRSRKTQSPAPQGNNFFLSLALASILFASIIIILQQTTVKGFGNGVLFAQEIVHPTPIVLPILTPMVTPTPNPTPLPEQLSGYCLSVPVLMYHHIQPMEQAIKNGQTSLTVDSTVFESQMEYLTSHGYQTILAEDLVNALRQKRSLPSKSIVITIDDGYSDIYSYAYPIARKYSVVLNLMIPTGLINNTGYLTWDNLVEMLDSKKATAANHTWSHFQLTRGEHVKQQMEILTAKTQLIEHTGGNSPIFSYPYGSFNDTTVRILQENNYNGAFSTIPGTTQCDSIIFSLRRVRIGSIPLSNYGL